MRHTFGIAFLAILGICFGAACAGVKGAPELLGGTPSTVPAVQHVFLVVEENHSYSSVIGNPVMPFLNSLATQYGLATDYFADLHPSLNNYFLLTTGKIVTQDGLPVPDSFSGTVSGDNIVRELISAGKTWKSYAQGLPGVGYTGGDVYPYLERHNPASYFSDVRNSTVQAANLVPITQFAADQANGALPNFSFIVPDAEHSAHDCPDGTQTCNDAVRLSNADNWLRTNIGPLVSSRLFQQNGLLVIVFDESFVTDIAFGGGHVAAIVVGPQVKRSYQSKTFFQHPSTLRLIVESTGAADFPGVSVVSPDMGEFFK